MSDKLHIGVGSSEAVEAGRAGENAVRRALQDFRFDGGEEPRFGLVFCSGGKYGRGESIEKLVAAADDELRSASEDIDWIGCTTAGEIFRGELRTGSCIALVMSSPYMEVGVGAEEGVKVSPVEAGKKAALSIRDILESRGGNSPSFEGPHEKFLLALSPGLTWFSPGKEDMVAEGISEVVGEEVPVFGGTSGHNVETGETHQFMNGEIFSDAVIVSAVSAGLRTGFSFGNGFNKTNKICRVTKADGYEVQELDGEPALERYADLLEFEVHELWSPRKMEAIDSDVLDSLSAQLSVIPDPYSVPFTALSNVYPLGIIDSEGNISARSPKRVNGDAIEFTQRIPEDSVLNILEYKREESRKAEQKAIEDAVGASGDRPGILLIAEDILRNSYVGKENMEEIFGKAGKDYPESVIFGFNSKGEYIHENGKALSAATQAVSVGCIADMRFKSKEYEYAG